MVGGHGVTQTGDVLACIVDAMANETTNEQAVDEQDAGDGECVIALTPVQLGIVMAIVAAVVVWLVARRRRTA